MRPPSYKPLPYFLSCILFDIAEIFFTLALSPDPCNNDSIRNFVSPQSKAQGEYKMFAHAVIL